MAIANLLVKIGADIAELKTGSDKAIATMEKTSGRIDSIASSIRSTLIGAFSVNAVINFGQELLRMGDDIVRTADRTGLLTDEVQRLSFIASQSGNSIEDVTAAIGQMQNRLASGDKSAVSAVKALGLSFDDLRRMNPYDQMAAIADAVGRIPDPATRAQVAMELFGRSGIALLPTLTAKFKELGDAAPIISEDTVRALDSAGDAFDKFSLTVKVFAANLYNYAGKGFDQLVASFYRMIGGLYEGTAKLVQLTSKIPGSSKVFGDLNDNIASLTTTSHWYADAASSLEAGAVKATRAVTNFVPPVVAAGKAHEAAAGHTRAHVAALKEEIAIAPDVQHAMDLVAIAHQHQVAALDLEASSWKATENAMSGYLAKLPTANVVLGGTRNITSIVPMIAADVADNAGNLTSIGRDAGIYISTGLSAAFQSALTNTFDDLAGLLSGAIRGAASIGDALKEFSTNVAKDFFGTMLSFIPGIGPALSALAGPLVDGFKKLWGHFFGTAGRDAVKDFAGSFGGFDALHATLNDLGAEGEQLWIRLTQGVGRNNPREAQAAIDAIADALARQKTKHEEVGAAAAVASQAQSDAAQKAQDAIRALDNEMSSLLKSIENEAPEEVMGVVESNTRARIAAITAERNHAQTALDDTAREAAAGAERTAQAIDDALQNHDFRVRIHFNVDDFPAIAGSVPGYATGTRGQYVDFGTGTMAMLHGRERVVTEGEDLGVDGGGTVTLTAPEALSLLRGEIVTVARKDAARGGLRSRAAHGRSF